MDNFPTKKNLILAKQNLKVAKRGFALLELKLGVLAKQRRQAEQATDKLREELQALRDEFERAKLLAEMETGRSEIAGSFPYNMATTCAAYDEAFLLRERIVVAEEALVAAEAALAEVKMREKRAKKRANALREVIIPEQMTRVKYISEHLEEAARDELVRVRSSVPLQKQIQRI